MNEILQVLAEMRERQVARGFRSNTLIEWADRIEAALRDTPEPIGWVFQHEDTGRMVFCENDGVNNAENFAANNRRYVLCGPAYNTPWLRGYWTDTQVGTAMAELHRALKEGKLPSEAWRIALTAAVRA